jgi:hypothetical protein
MNRLAAIALLIAGASAAAPAHAQQAFAAASGNATPAAPVAAPSALADYRSATVIAAETIRCGAKLCDDYVLTSADTQYYVRAAHRSSAPKPALAAGATELFHVDGTTLHIAADASHKARTLTVVSAEPLHPARPYLHGIG